MAKISLITPTGGRPKAFELLVRWMRRQTFEGQVRWIIVNDVDIGVQTPEMPGNWSCELVRPEPRWRPGDNTQARNLLAALARVNRNDRVVVIEDDDWYSQDWLETVDQMLDKAELVGETRARYYNIEIRKGRELENERHACLSATAMRGSAIRSFHDACSDRPGHIDLELWKRHHSKHLFAGHNVVGMKGLPGRPGIGIGHRNNFRGQDDPDGTLLRAWIEIDAGYYA